MKQKNDTAKNTIITRVLTGVIGFAIVIAILLLGNKYVIDVVFSIVAIISIYEYFNALKTNYKPFEIIGYILAIWIAFIHIIPVEYQLMGLAILIPTIIAILFIKVIVSKMETNFNDIAITFFGIMYVIGFIAFLPLIYGSLNGKILIWYLIIASWGSDTFAYAFGMKFGKRKLSAISPKKSVEGSIAGIIGTVLLSLIYTAFINHFTTMNINLLFITAVSILLGALGQIGDLAASSIKRHCNIKDFGNLLPGHGGMLDRIDSFIFIAPFAYFLLMMI